MKIILAVFSLTLLTTGIIIYMDEILQALNRYDYDMYVLSIQYGPNYCAIQKEEQFAKCKKLALQTPNNAASVHGLWPSFQTAKIEDCHKGTEIPIKDNGTDLFLWMRKYWPTFGTNTNEVFWGHEYNKHGYCYSELIGDYDYMLYFQKVKEIYDKFNLEVLIRELFGDNEPGEYEFSKNAVFSRLDTFFGGRYYSFNCKKNTVTGKFYLQEIRLNLDLNFQLFKQPNKDTTCNNANILNFVYY